ncbi:MAG: hypothetical protein WKG07_30485 [Hymenobacter sp.]
MSPEELAEGAAQVPAELQAAIRQAIRNIETFHAAQRPAAVEADSGNHARRALLAARRGRAAGGLVRAGRLGPAVFAPY